MTYYKKSLEIIKKEDRMALSRSEAILRDGGILIVPTDTVYGIVGLATNENVVKKIFTLKKRSREKALPIFVKDLSMAKKYVEAPIRLKYFFNKIWPGGVTVIFKNRGNLPKILTGGFSTIGVRIPDYPFILNLIRRLNAPLVQTSANISGQPPAKNVDELLRCFEKERIRPDCIIDGGELPHASSTIIDVTYENPIILREGMLKKKKIERLLQKHRLS